MQRTQSPRGQVLLSVVLALLVGAFLLPPTVTASDVGGSDDDGLYIGGGHNGSGGGGKNSQGGGQDGDDTDPDWWTMSIRFQVQESDKVESPVIRSVQVYGPFGGFISWLLKEASSRYLSLWK